MVSVRLAATVARFFWINFRLAKSSVPDADDTSKSLITQKLLGKKFSAAKLVEKFEGKEHFLTYMMERHPSVTTNCNVLSALLEADDITDYMPQIEKLARYLCHSWARTDVPFADKWVRIVLLVPVCRSIR